VGGESKMNVRAFFCDQAVWKVQETATPKSMWFTGVYVLSIYQRQTEDDIMLY